MDKMKLILEHYDIKHLSNRCNFHGCNKKPTKLVEIVERNNMKRRSLAKIYVCDEHFKSIKNLVEKLNKMSKGVFIETIVSGL